VVDNMGRVRENATTDIKDAKAGRNLETTLDLDLQVVAELAMEARRARWWRSIHVTRDPGHGEPPCLRSEQVRRADTIGGLEDPDRQSR